ncbi:unnamed protein product [Peniophora sp. CBMAI 1063]|nr:unnamed protein product [Peniophora sp. CBMAI 1063]
MVTCQKCRCQIPPAAEKVTSKLKGSFHGYVWKCADRGTCSDREWAHTLTECYQCTDSSCNSRWHMHLHRSSPSKFYMSLEGIDHFLQVSTTVNPTPAPTPSPRDMSMSSLPMPTPAKAEMSQAPEQRQPTSTSTAHPVLGTMLSQTQNVRSTAQTQTSPRNTTALQTRGSVSPGGRLPGLYERADDDNSDSSVDSEPKPVTPRKRRSSSSLRSSDNPHQQKALRFSTPLVTDRRDDTPSTIPSEQSTLDESPQRRGSSSGMNHSNDSGPSTSSGSRTMHSFSTRTLVGVDWHTKFLEILDPAADHATLIVQQLYDDGAPFAAVKDAFFAAEAALEFCPSNRAVRVPQNRLAAASKEWDVLHRLAEKPGNLGRRPSGRALGKRRAN